jgi:hypothetical protein
MEAGSLNNAARAVSLRAIALTAERFSLSERCDAWAGATV